MRKILSFCLLAAIVALSVACTSHATTTKKTSLPRWETAPTPPVDSFIDMVLRRVDLDAILEYHGWVGSRDSWHGKTCEARASESAGALTANARVRIVVDGRKSRIEFDYVGSYCRVCVFCDEEWEFNTMLIADGYGIPKDLVDILDPVFGAINENPYELDTAILEYLEEEEAEGIGVVFYAVSPEEADWGGDLDG